MTRNELRSYILKHRDDDDAFRVYIDRFKSEDNEIYPAPQSIEDLKNFPELQRQHQERRRQA